MNAPVVRPFAVTHRSVVAIAVPMTLAHLSTPLIGITDMAVIGQLGSAVLIGAVALGAILFDFIGGTLNFLRSGTTGLTAQALGAADEEMQLATLWRALALAAAIGAAMVVLQTPILAAFLALMGASPDVDAATADYFGVRVYGMPLMLANYAILGWLLGLGRATVGLVLQMVLGVVNIALSVTFVLGLELGVAGVAAASVLAELAALAAGLFVVRHALGTLRPPDWRRIADRAALVRMFAVNRDIMIRSLLLLFAFAFFTAQGARTDDVTLAANALLMNIFLFSAHFLDGLATAAEQLAGRAVGACYRPAFDRAVTLTVGWGFVVSGVLTLAIFAGGGALIDLLTTSEPVREAARTYLVWAALTPLIGTLAFQMDGVFIGATWTATMRNMMILSTALYLAVWWMTREPLGNHGLWIALLTFLGARGITLSWRCGMLVARTFRDTDTDLSRAPVRTAEPV